MIQEKYPNDPPNFSKYSELRSSTGESISETVDPLELIIEKHLPVIGKYKLFDSDMAWESFKKRI